MKWLADNTEIPELGEYSAGVIEELRTGQLLKQELAEADSRRAAALGRERFEIPGVGHVTLSVPGLAWHYWGQREGYECWDDDGGRESFCAQFRRDNPQCAVKWKPRKVTVGWTRPTPRFRKVYNW